MSIHRSGPPQKADRTLAGLTRTSPPAGQAGLLLAVSAGSAVSR
ncbi:hypothetical protein ACW14Y_42590 (plasmid) [Kitasatospora sp. cg17-2]